MKAVSRELSFKAGDSPGAVSAPLLRPDKAEWVLVLGHGAGAD